MDIPDRIMKNMAGNGRGNGGVVIGIMLSIFDVFTLTREYNFVHWCIPVCDISRLCDYLSCFLKKESQIYIPVLDQS